MGNNRPDPLEIMKASASHFDCQPPFGGGFVLATGGLLKGDIQSIALMGSEEPVRWGRSTA